MSHREPPTVPNTPRNGLNGERKKVESVPDTIAPAASNGSGEGCFGPPTQPNDIGSFGPYRILKQLGKGGMGTVYFAEDTRLNRQVALKLCHRANNQAYLERFRSEARAAASLRHPNLCPVHECDEIGGVPYFTMALIEGPTLERWVEQRGGLSQRDAALLTRKMALAMQYAHEHGVIHRDLKPSNVAMEKLEPVILDFGLARQGDARLTVHGSVMGTPAYMAPEQVKGDVEGMGPSCDIYSLGAMFYELLTGSVPFEGSPLQALSLVMTANPRPPSELQPGIDHRLEAICLKCLAKAPADRWPDMKSLAAAIGEWAKSGADGPTAKNRGKPPARPGGETLQVAVARETAVAKIDEELAQGPAVKWRGDRRKKNKRSRNSWKKPVLGILAAVMMLAALVTVIVSRRHRAEPPTHEKPSFDNVTLVSQPESASLQILPLDRVTISAGRTHLVTVKIARPKAAGAVIVQILDLPPEVKGQSVIVDEGQDTATLELTADKDAGAAIAKCRLVASVGKLKTEREFAIAVENVARPSLQVILDSSSIALIAGETRMVRVLVKRNLYSGPVVLDFVRLPPKVTAKKTTLPEGEDEVTIELAAALDSAPAGEVERDAAVSASGEKLKGEQSVKVVVSPKPALRITQAPERVLLRAGQNTLFAVHVQRMGCKGEVRIKVSDLPPGTQASDLLIPADQDQGQIDLFASIDKADKQDIVKKATIRATIGELKDARPLDVTLEKRETLTPAGTARGYLHDRDIASAMIAVVAPGTRPVRYRIATGVEVRVPQAPLIVDELGNTRKPTADELKVLRGDGRLSGYKGSISDLRLDRYVQVELGKSADGSLAARTIIIMNPPAGYPPPPPPGPPGGGGGRPPGKKQ